MPRARVPEPEKDKSERWLLTYADMITLLLALFVVLFASSQVDEQKMAEVAAGLQRGFNIPAPAGAESQGLVPSGNIAGSPGVGGPAVNLASVGASIGSELVAFAEREHLGSGLSVSVSQDGVVVTMAGSLAFGSGSAQLRPEGRQALELVAATLRTLPVSPTIRIDGHTDDVTPNTPEFPSNWELSAARAASVARHLAAAGLDRHHLTAVGVADTQPIADNATPEGRAQNRRVELWILAPGAEAEAGAAALAAPAH
ncbi:MAG: flagellar motor protein MotB [Chloroflexota bacterium]